MTRAEKVEFAARLRAHISVLAAALTTMQMSVEEWNTIAFDFYDAADLIQGTEQTSDKP